MLVKKVIFLLSKFLIPALFAASSAFSQSGPTAGSPSAASNTRIVSLAPHFTELVFAVGAEKLLVGVTEQCDFPPQAKGHKKVGSLMRPNLEAIVALQPTLVLASEITPRETLHALKKLHLRVLEVSPQRASAVPGMFLQVGEALHAQKKANILASELERAILALQKSGTERKKKASSSQEMFKLKAAILLQLAPPILAGENSWLGDIFSQAGYLNIASKIHQPWPKVSREFLISENPRFIFTETPSLGTKSEDLETAVLQIWKGVTKRPIVIKVPADILMRPGPRLAQGLAFLSQIPGEQNPP